MTEKTKKTIANETTPYPRSTGEFEIPGLKSNCKNSSAIFKGGLHVLAAMSTEHSYRGHYITHAKFPLDKLIKKKTSKNTTDDEQIDWDAKAIKNPDNWKTVISWDDSGPWWASSPRNPDEAVYHSDNTSLVAHASILWSFYVWSKDDSNLRIRAKKYQEAQKSDPKESDSDGSDLEGSWGPGIDLYNPDGKLAENIGAISACAFGESQILLAGCGTSANGAYSQPHDTISFYLFDVNDIKVDKSGKSTWQAKSVRVVNIKNDITYYMGNQPQSASNINSGRKMDIDWFYTTKPDKQALNKRIPQYYLTIAFAPNVPWTESYTWTGFLPLSLTNDDDEESSDLADNPWGAGKLEFYNQGDGIESSIKRDPSGRLQRFTRYSNNKFSSLYFSTANPPTLANGYGNLEPKTSPTFTVTDNTTVPYNTYYTFEDGKKEIQTTGQGYDKKPKKIKAIEYPVLEFICYGHNKCQLHDYGAIITASDTQKPVSKGKIEEVIVGGYFDGPIPFPLENFIGQPLSNNSLPVGNFIYKTKKDKDKESGVESDWSIGFEADGKTTEGLGPAFKVSLEGGMGSTEKETLSSEFELELPVTAEVKNAGGNDNANPYPEAGGVVSVLSSRLLITGYQFRNAQGKLINDALSGDKAQSPKIGAALTRMAQADVTHYTFEPFIVKPGNLKSYTAPEINARMKELGYTGDNYFRDVVCRNAYPIGEFNPYIALTWDLGNAGKINEFQTKSSFKEQSWKFDTSLYAGFSGGGGIDFFGLGEEFEFSFMAGATYSRDRTKSNIETSGWGVGISEDWGPMVPLLDEHEKPISPLVKNWVCAYSFRAYFLPVPTSKSELHANHWTTEFTTYNKKETLVRPNVANSKRKIDPNSGCWRILFVVTDIKYGKGSTKEDYSHDTDLDGPSIYS